MQKIWIFQLDQNIRPIKAEELTAYIQDGLETWKTHGKAVTNRCACLHGRFIVIEALSDTSGCSVDWLNQQVENACKQVRVLLEDAGRVCIRTDQGLVSLPFNDLIQKVEAGILSLDTIIFDNTVVHGNSIARWEKPIAESWLANRISILN